MRTFNYFAPLPRKQVFYATLAYLQLLLVAEECLLAAAAATATSATFELQLYEAREWSCCHYCTCCNVAANGANNEFMLILLVVDAVSPPMLLVKVSVAHL